jgi:hypothetical protein
MATTSPPAPNLDRYVVIHVATTCDEHGVYVTKDSAEVIEVGWILLDAKSCEEVHSPHCSSEIDGSRLVPAHTRHSSTASPASSSRSIRQLRRCAVSAPPMYISVSLWRC